MIIAAHAGTGKSTLAAMYPDRMVDFVAMPYKYYLDELEEPAQGDAEAGKNKANPNLNMRIEWPYNYVEAIKEALAGEKTLLIPAAFDVLRLLRKDNIPYTLCYPQRDAKEVYRKRYLDRGNTEDFLEIFIGGWERFLDYLEQDTYGQHIVMQPHEFLSDVITCDKGCAVYTMDERLKELKQKTLNSIKNGFCIEINKLTELWKNFIIARKI